MTIYEQLTIFGGVEYLVYFKNNTYIFKDYPTKDDLLDPRRRGVRLD